MAESSLSSFVVSAHFHLLEQSTRINCLRTFRNCCSRWFGGEPLSIDAILVLFRWTRKLLSRSAGLEGDANPDPGTRWRREDNDSVPLTGRRGGDDYSDDRLQRRASDVQKPKVSSVGSGRTDEHTTILAVLLQQHRRNHLCRRLGRSGSNRDLKRRIALHA